MPLTQDQSEFAFLMARNDTFEGLHQKLVTALIGETVDPDVWVLVKAIGYKLNELERQKQGEELRANLLLRPPFADF